MKHLLLFISLLMISVSVNAGGRWKSVDSFIISGHPAVVIAVSFITAANKGNYEQAKSYMTAEYINWRQKLTGVDTFFAVFENDIISNYMENIRKSETDLWDNLYKAHKTLSDYRKKKLKKSINNILSSMCIFV